MSSAVRWDGLVELRDQLRRLPEDLTTEARDVIRDTAQAAHDEIRDAYPEVTGALKRGMSITVGYGQARFGASSMIKNRAKHAWLFDNGSQARFYLGARRGVMPPRPPSQTFIGVVMRRRRAMYEKLKTIVERAGLRVSGDEAA